MFLGVVQGFFLAVVLLTRSKKGDTTFFLGLTFLFQSLVFLDNYLCYTGLMKHILQFNDSTEPFVLLIAPTFYLFVVTVVQRKILPLKNYWYHLFFPAVYAITQIGYYRAPLAVKFNAYKDAYHSYLPYANVTEDFHYTYHWIKDQFHLLVLLSILTYAVLAIRMVWQERNRMKVAPGKSNSNRYLFTRNSIFFLVFFFCLALYIFVSYEDDSGDHYMSMLQTILVYFTTYVLLVSSRFFENSWFADKYETFSNATIELGVINEFLERENYIENPELSLNSLAEKLGVSKNTLSKTINSHAGMNFNDFINQKRVGIAKDRLLSSDFRHLTIEAIGNSVGFNSKSAFYTAFKKFSGVSPKMFVKEKLTIK